MAASHVGDKLENRHSVDHTTNKCLHDQVRYLDSIQSVSKATEVVKQRNKVISFTF